MTSITPNIELAPDVLIKENVIELANLDYRITLTRCDARAVGRKSVYILEGNYAESRGRASYAEYRSLKEALKGFSEIRKSVLGRNDGFGSEHLLGFVFSTGYSETHRSWGGVTGPVNVWSHRIYVDDRFGMHYIYLDRTTKAIEHGCDDEKLIPECVHVAFNRDSRRKRVMSKQNRAFWLGFLMHHGRIDRIDGMRMFMDIMIKCRNMKERSVISAAVDGVLL